MTGPTLPTRLAKKVARTPVELARWPRTLSRRAPREAENYLTEHAIDWQAVAEASPEDAADILEAIGADAAGDLIANLEPDHAAELFEELRDELVASLLTELPVGEAGRILESSKRWPLTRPPMSSARSTPTGPSVSWSWPAVSSPRRYETCSVIIQSRPVD